MSAVYILFIIILFLVLFVGVYQVYLDLTHRSQRACVPYAIKASGTYALDLPPPEHYVQSFVNHDIVHIPHFLNESLFNDIVQECTPLTMSSSNRTHDSLKMFRKGETVGPNAMEQYKLVSTLGLYYHPQFIEFLSHIFNTPQLSYVPLDDMSRYTLLFYNQPQDGITWHFDGNHYMGRRFTIILVLQNQGSSGSKSCAKFQYIDKKDGSLKSIEASPNDLIAFDSSTLFHRATAMCPGDSRLLLSFTYADDLRRSAPGMIANFVKSKVMKFV